MFWVERHICEIFAHMHIITKCQKKSLFLNYRVDNINSFFNVLKIQFLFWKKNSSPRLGALHFKKTRQIRCKITSFFSRWEFSVKFFMMNFEFCLFFKKKITFLMSFFSSISYYIESFVIFGNEKFIYRWIIRSNCLHGGIILLFFLYKLELLFSEYFMKNLFWK